MILIKKVKPKCGEQIKTYEEKIGKDVIILLLPITTSKTNQSYNMPMVHKEIAYRKDYSKSYFQDYGFGFITYDFCNDLSTLMEILVNITFDSPGSSIITFTVLHANAEFIKPVQAVLKYFQVYLTAIISDTDNPSISTYSST